LHLAGLQAPVGLFPRLTQGLALLTLLLVGSLDILSLVGSLDILSLVMETSCDIQEGPPLSPGDLQRDILGSPSILRILGGMLLLT
jgi:hypothetical protein